MSALIRLLAALAAFCGILAGRIARNDEWVDYKEAAESAMKAADCFVQARKEDSTT